MPRICAPRAELGSHHLASHHPRFLTFALVAALCIPLTACNHTPTYSGPPNLVLHVLMKKWDIVPNRIEIPQGAHVELIVITADVEHGLAVPALAINEPVQPGKTTFIRFLAAKPGTYPMRCSILCGRGHDQMTGVIVIEPSPATASRER
ncbi:MAG: cupredoxin domain-containing protein [Acidobacteriaceae bacterium]